MYLTMSQTAEKLQNEPRTIMRRIADGSLKAIKLGHKTIRVDEQDLATYMEQHKTA